MEGDWQNSGGGLGAHPVPDKKTIIVDVDIVT
jgi:hypothetical protein